MLADSLQATSSHFGRLLQAASHAKSQPGDLSEEGSRAWREACIEHLAIFEDWLALGLRQKQADIEHFAAEQDSSPARVLQASAPTENHQDLIPRWALSHQRELFAMELEVLFLVAEPGLQHQGALLKLAQVTA